jgi:hypothetical protein
MSIEVERQEYLFRPDDHSLDEDDLFNPKQITPKLQFYYNPLHDLESIWWLAIWFPFNYRHKGAKSDNDLEDAHAQLDRVKMLFPRCLLSAQRRDQFSLDRVFMEGISCLPVSFIKTANDLELARQLLRNRFRKAERGDAIDAAAFEGVHSLLIRIFQRSMPSCKGIALQPLHSFINECMKNIDLEGKRERPEVAEVVASSKRRKLCND